MHGLCQHNTTLPANIAGSTMLSFTLTVQKNFQTQRSEKRRQTLYLHKNIWDKLGNPRIYTISNIPQNNQNTSIKK
jgi:hypothetical protein